MNGAPMILECDTQLLATQMTPHEIDLRAREAARQKLHRDKLEVEMKAETKRLKDALTAADAVLARMATEADSGTEMRRVPCTTLFDPIAYMVTVTRDDTGEVVQRRPPTNEEEREYERKREKERQPELRLDTGATLQVELPQGEGEHGDGDDEDEDEDGGPRRMN